MKDYKDKFEKLKLKYPDHSSIMVFIKLVRNKKIGDVQLRKAFDLVDRSDWSGTPKEQIIRWLKNEILKSSPK